MANKVLFGFSDLYVGTYTVDDYGVVTMGTPYHQAGAVGFSPEANTDVNHFRADNINYYTVMGSGAYEGDLEVAMFDDAFKKAFMGFIELDDGGLAAVKNPQKVKVWMAFAIQGDEAERRVIFYNGDLGAPSRTYSTTEETVEPVTETCNCSFIGDNETGIVMVTYEKGDAGYADLFTNPPAPALPSE